MSLRAFGITALLILVILSIGMRGGPEGRYTPGVLVQSDPAQNEPSSRTKWKYGDYLVTPLADYDITARIVAKSSYWWDAESAVSPLDIGVAWGNASDQSILDRLTLRSSQRFLNWRFQGEPPLPIEELISHIANIHIVPADKKVSKSLSRIALGDIAQLRGSLIQVESADGWHWASSLSRTDDGAGACELMWVTDAIVLRHPPK